VDDWAEIPVAQTNNKQSAASGGKSLRMVWREFMTGHSLSRFYAPVEKQWDSFAIVTKRLTS
jgi:hypothetical protein